MADIAKYDLAVIGAGWYGLGATKAYLEVNPTATAIIFEKASTVGGVWAKERLYPGLKSNNILGTYEYSDYPMDKAALGIESEKHVPGHAVHRYLTNFARHFGLYDKIQLRSTVEIAENQEAGGWIITYSTHNLQGAHSTSRVYASRLVVATGLTSEPSIPKLAGSEIFKGLQLHNKEFSKCSNLLEKMQDVCIIGGAKSGWDMVYECASMGLKVNWVMRELGHGPVWFSPPYLTPLKLPFEKLVHIRFLTFFNPCIWGGYDGFKKIRSLLHGTRAGQYIVDKFWGLLHWSMLSETKYLQHPETARLVPWSTPFDIATSLSILNYDMDIFEFIRNGTVKIHIADIKNLAEKSVSLCNNTILEADAVIYCTGWKFTPPLAFYPDNVVDGIPHYGTSHPSHISKEAVEHADHQILSSLPRLGRMPDGKTEIKPFLDTESEHVQRYSLYRFMIPPSHVKYRDLAFDTILHNRFLQWRYSKGHGDKFPDMVFDIVPYFDMLLLDLGLESHRKKNLFAELFFPYGQKDYVGLVQEWLAGDPQSNTEPDMSQSSTESRID